MISIKDNSIVFHSLPLPPSANTMYEPTVIKRKRKDGFGLRVGVGRRKSAELEHFQMQCLSFKNQKHQDLAKVRSQIRSWLMDGYYLSVDTIFVFHVERVFTVHRKLERLDADNRRKPMQDMVGEIIDLDDKYFFAGQIEKATCIKKESECSIIVINPVKPRTLETIRSQIMNTLGSS